MPERLTDDEAARQILTVFAANKVEIGGMLRRMHFFSVRDSDFQRGLDRAVEKHWLVRLPRDRYRYILTAHGCAAYSTLPSAVA